MGLKKGEGHANVCPWSYRGSPTEQKGSSLFGKKKKKLGRNRRVKWSVVRIRVGLLMLSSKMYVYSITKNRLEIYFEFP